MAFVERDTLLLVVSELRASFTDNGDCLLCLLRYSILLRDRFVCCGFRELVGNFVARVLGFVSIRGLGRRFCYRSTLFAWLLNWYFRLLWLSTAFIVILFRRLCHWLLTFFEFALRIRIARSVSLSLNFFRFTITGQFRWLDIWLSLNIFWFFIRWFRVFAFRLNIIFLRWNILKWFVLRSLMERRSNTSFTWVFYWLNWNLWGRFFLRLLLVFTIVIFIFFVIILIFLATDNGVFKALGSWSFVYEYAWPIMRSICVVVWRGNVLRILFIFGRDYRLNFFTSVMALNWLFSVVITLIRLLDWFNILFARVVTHFWLEIRASNIAYFFIITSRVRRTDLRRNSTCCIIT